MRYQIRRLFDATARTSFTFTWFFNEHPRLLYGAIDDDRPVFADNRGISDKMLYIPVQICRNVVSTVKIYLLPIVNVKCVATPWRCEGMFGYTIDWHVTYTKLNLACTSMCRQWSTLWTTSPIMHRRQLQALDIEFADVVDCPKLK